MLENRDVFLKDPSANPIPNLGVTKVGEPETPEEWDVLRYELRSFVCEGEYRRGGYDPHHRGPIDLLMGAAVLMPREVFHRGGQWDEDFAFGGEDLDVRLLDHTFVGAGNYGDFDVARGHAIPAEGWIAHAQRLFAGAE